MANPLENSSTPRRNFGSMCRGAVMIMLFLVVDLCRSEDYYERLGLSK